MPPSTSEPTFRLQELEHSLYADLEELWIGMNVGRVPNPVILYELRNAVRNLSTSWMIPFMIFTPRR